MKPPEGHPDFNRKYWKLNKAIWSETKRTRMEQRN